MEKHTVRITLRMSERLHDLLTQAADDRPLNTEIVRRLESTFSIDTKSGVNGTINDLGGKCGYVTRSEVEAMILEAIGKKESR